MSFNLGSGTTQTGQSTHSMDPALTPYVTDALNQAQTYFNQGVGSNPYIGPTQAPINPILDQSLQGIYNTANTLAPTAMQPYAAALNGISNYGMTPQMQDVFGGFSGVANNPGITTAPDFASLRQTALTQNQPYAAGSAGVGTAALTLPTASGTNLAGIAAGNDRTNPYLQRMIDFNLGRIGDQTASALSGAGRYGQNAAFADLMSRNMVGYAVPTLANAYENAASRMLTANNMIDQFTNQRFGLGLQGYGQAANINSTGTGLGIQAAQGQTAAEQAAAQDRLAALSGAGNLANQGNQAALSWAQLAPQLAGASYQPYQTAGQIGSFLQSYDQNALNSQIAQYNAMNQLPQQLLNNYLGATSGMGALYNGLGTATGTVTQQNTPGLMQLLGLFGAGNVSPIAGLTGAVTGGLGALGRFL